MPDTRRFRVNGENLARGHRQDEAHGGPPVQAASQMEAGSR
jgi:hypothetical protein